MSKGLSSTQKRASLVILSMLMLSTIAATQFASSDLGYSFSITGGDSGIRFIGHDDGVDAVILLRADDDDGSNLRMELGDWARGQTVTYTAAFGIVNENQYAINITSVSITGSGNASIYAWLHNNADTEAVSDGGTLIFDNGEGAQEFYWLLAAGNSNAADANSITTPLNAQSHTRTLTAADNAANTDHVWVQIKLVIPQSASNGQFSGTVSFDFVEAEEVLAVTSPNGGESWEVGAVQNILWSGLDETADNVKLEYSKDNFASDVNTIVASTPNDGSYAWTLPNDVDDSVWVRVSDTSDATRNDTSDASFEIAASDSNLMAYWRFDEGSGSSTLDSTINDNDGTLYDGATFSSLAMANSSLDARVDHSNVVVADDATLDIGTGSYSFETWFNSDQGGNKYMFRKIGSESSEYWLMLAGDEVKFKVKDNDGDSVEIKHNSDYADGEWHYVVGVVDQSADYLYLYIDGSNAVTPLSITSIGNVSNDGVLIIGAKDSAGGDEFKGYLDEMKFHNRVLSASEISAKYTEWAKSLTLTGPNGGETLPIGNSHSITWASEGDIDYVKLEYSTDNFVSDVNTIVASTANDGSHSWNVPDDANWTVKVRVSDASASAVNDLSDATFEIGDLRHWWKFDETSGTVASDMVSTDTKDGSLYNGATWSASGMDNRSVNLDGTDDYVKIGDHSTTDISDTDNVALAFWYKADTASTEQYLLNKGEGEDSKYYMVKLTSSGQLHTEFKDDDGTIVSLTTTGTDYDDGNWYHVVVVLDRTADYLYLYVGGDLKQSVSASALGTMSNGKELYVGTEKDEHYFDGLIDDFRFYYVKLTSGEVSTLYDSY